MEKHHGHFYHALMLNRLKCVLHLLICSHQNNTRFHKKTFILVQNENHGHNLTTEYARETQSGQRVIFVQYGAPYHYHLLSVHQTFKTIWFQIVC